MQTQMTDVIYNAVTQCFEATVTVHDGAKRVSYPCAINAPITMSYERAAVGLAKQALRRHGKPQGLRSIMMPSLRLAVANAARRGLPEGQYGFFRGRAA